MSVIVLLIVERGLPHYPPALSPLPPHLFIIIFAETTRKKLRD